MMRSICCRLLLACFLLTLGAVALSQQADPRESKLLVLERLWNEAQVNRDASALDALVSSRFVNTEWDGEISDKQRFLADIKDPRFKPTVATIQDVKMNFLAMPRWSRAFITRRELTRASLMTTSDGLPTRGFWTWGSGSAWPAILAC